MNTYCYIALPITVVVIAGGAFACKRYYKTKLQESLDRELDSAAQVDGKKSLKSFQEPVDSDTHQPW